jgi:integration host factor subunit beta
VTKKEIVKTISDEIGLTQLKTKEIVQKTFDAIVETLVEDKRIELRNFGVFEVKKRAARKARNPRTGDKVYVPEKYVVTFKPGKEMEERVRELERQAAAAAAAKQAHESSPVAEVPDPSPTPGGPAVYDAHDQDSAAS